MIKYIQIVISMEKNDFYENDKFCEKIITVENLTSKKIFYIKINNLDELTVFEKRYVLVYY